MKLHIPIKYQEKPEYPTVNEIMEFTESYRLNFMPLPDPDKAWHKFEHSRSIEVLVIGGLRRFFLIYSYPPAGFEVAKPEEVPDLDLWRGWILKYLGPGSGYKLDTSTERDGEAEFKRRKTELGY
ncbi:unnamed protein product [marine sediment metagenome]|uniref:Uncharacterized protein n=1 Tax=marine sediment metagenome TaxID=412755 RepID=X1GJW8_9ZZZZ